MTLDEIQNLIYVLCHTYARATRAVSIPCVVYYADVVCRRLAFHLSREVLAGDVSDTASAAGEAINIAELKDPQKGLFRQVTPRCIRTMYWM